MNTIYYSVWYDLTRNQIRSYSYLNLFICFTTVLTIQSNTLYPVLYFTSLTSHCLTTIAILCWTKTRYCTTFSSKIQFRKKTLQTKFKYCHIASKNKTLSMKQRICIKYLSTKSFVKTRGFLPNCSGLTCNKSSLMLLLSSWILAKASS